MEGGFKMEKDDRQHSIKEMLQCIEKKPCLYLGTNERRVDYLFQFLMGRLDPHENEINGIFRSEFTQWIYNWIVKKGYSEGLEFKFSFIWYKMIYSVTNSEEEAWNLFFQIAHDYFNQPLVEK